MKVDTKREFFVLRKGSGEQRAQRMGTAFPAGAEVRIKKDRHALVFPDGGFRVLRGTSYEDAVSAALKEAAVGNRKGTVTIARAVGTFGEANLYEAALSFSPDELGFTDPVRQHWKERAKALGKTEEDIEFRFGAFKTTTPEGKAAQRGKNLKIEGMASTPDVDRDVDTILPAAFQGSIERFLDNPVMLWMHNHTLPIGFWTEVAIDENGVAVKGEVVDEQIKDWIETRGVRMLSVGFIPLDGEFKEDPETGELLRVITQAELLEVSVVTVPSNPFARFSVSKAVKAVAPECEAANCCDGKLFCTCPDPTDVVEYRRFQIAPEGSDWTRGAPMVVLAGQEGARLTASWSGEDGPELPHSARVGDDLQTIPELVRASMAQVVAYHGDWSESDRNALWATLGRRWMDCFPSEAVPVIDKYPAPGLFRKTLEGDGVVSVGSVIVSKGAISAKKDAATWVRDHGFSTLKIEETSTDFVFSQRDGTYTKTIELGPGVTGAIVTATVDDDRESDEDERSEEKMTIEEMRRIAREEAEKLSSETDDTKDDGAEERPAGEADEDSSEEVEIDAEAAETLDALFAGKDVDDDALESAEDALAEALGIESDETN